MLTRRQFTAAATGLVSLTILGCDKQAPPASRSTDTAPATGPAATTAPAGAGDVAARATEPPATPDSLEPIEAGDLIYEPFIAGALDYFRERGIYTMHAARGIYLVNDGAKLLALSALCTHKQCAITYPPGGREFICPCHKSHFRVIDGEPLPDQKATEPLDRCRIQRVEPTPQADGTLGPVMVRVDPRSQYTRAAFGDALASLNMKP